MNTATQPYVQVCRICDGRGRILFRTIPSEHWMPCPCAETFEQALARVEATAERYLRALGWLK